MEYVTQWYPHTLIRVPREPRKPESFITGYRTLHRNWMMWGIYLAFLDVATKQKFLATDYKLIYDGRQIATIKFDQMLEIEDGTGTLIVDEAPRESSGIPTTGDPPSQNLTTTNKTTTPPPTKILLQNPAVDPHLTIKFSPGTIPLPLNSGYLTLAAALCSREIALPLKGQRMPFYTVLDFPDLDTSMEVWTRDSRSMDYGTLVSVLERAVWMWEEPRTKRVEWAA